MRVDSRLFVALGMVIGACLLLTRARCLAEEPAPRLCEPWEQEYADEDATGKHVIALYQFNAGAETKDGSGHGHDLKLEGAVANAAGRFGACLESFKGWPVEDKKHAAIAPNHPSLTPKGPFTIEMWIKPKPEIADYPDSFLLDKKYVDQTDYQLILSGADKKSNLRYLRMVLGFGADSGTFNSEKVPWEPNVWYHIAFTYDGAGIGAFYVNGIPRGKTEQPGRKGIIPGVKPLSIGDRIGSNYHGFPGWIDQVRICDGVLEFGRARFAFASERTTFRRMESGQTLRFRLTNLLRVPLKDATAWISVGGLAPKEFKAAGLPSGQSQDMDYLLDTSLRPDTYSVKAQVTIPGDRPYQSEESFPITLVARPLPRRMPVVMWGIGGMGALKEADRLKAIGFTHCLGLSVDFGKIWEEGKPTEAAKPESVAESKKMLDFALANDIGIIASLSPASWLRKGKDKEDLQRVNRDGKSYETKDREGDICALLPKIQEFCYNVGVSTVRTYGAFPAFQAAMIHTEVRDGTQLCFHEHDRKAFRDAAGFDIPEEAKSKGGVEYRNLKDFPADRVIPDDYPLLTFYKWFWKRGDGWNDLHSAVHKGLKSTGRDLWTYFDPAVRVPSVYGSGGDVDILSQWTYSYPDPIRIAVATDELFAMAKGGRAGQQVMKMTQIIWYRSQTAPPSQAALEQSLKQSVWEDTDPDAAFITIAPMHLREAFWTKIARPVRGIMYHGWQSLMPCDTPAGYRYTNPQTKNELSHLIKTVVEPIGPTLLQVPDIQPDVAFLESFASQMFARRGTWGWGGGWEGDAYHVLHYAQIQPEVIYDETLLQKGLDGYRVLVMMSCDVITKGMAEKIKAFQAKGGIVVGDDRLTPAIQPDVLLPSRDRTRKADEDKAALLTKAADLRKQLDPHYTRYLDSSNPEVVTHRRRFGQTDYVFVVNDRREYGGYVGRHGLVMENGLPSEAAVSVGRDGGFVYDLVNHEPVRAEVKDGRLGFEVRLGPCDGRVFMITPRAIEAVRVAGPEKVDRGGEATIAVEVVDGAGKAVDAVAPVRVDILDAEGRPAEFSGCYGAAGGKLEIPIRIASNDARGMWHVAVQELASGRTAVHYFRVQDPQAK